MLIALCDFAWVDQLKTETEFMLHWGMGVVLAVAGFMAAIMLIRSFFTKDA